MKIYKTKTGYAKNLATNEIFQAETIYLGCFDKEENYEDATKEEYDKYFKEEEFKAKLNEPLREGEIL